MRAPRIADFDPSPQVARAGYKRERRQLQLELLRMQIALRDDRSCGVAVVFEGVDAAGKGGAIARLTGRLDPRGFVVHPTDRRPSASGTSTSCSASTSRCPRAASS